MKKVLFIVTILLPAVLFSQKNTQSCSFFIVEQKTNIPLPDAEVFTKRNLLISDTFGSIKMPCNYRDSIMIRRLGYIPQTVVYSNNLDTVFLEVKPFIFDPVNVIEDKKRQKHKSRKKNSEVYFDSGLKKEYEELKSF